MQHAPVLLWVQVVLQNNLGAWVAFIQPHTPGHLGCARRSDLATRVHIKVGPLRGLCPSRPQPPLTVSHTVSVPTRDSRVGSATLHPGRLWASHCPFETGVM